MAYQVLARKWRPRSFHEMVGQTHVLKALVNALDNQRIHHAYLFTGTRGVGKTTISRIFAKCLNCEQGVSATPCGKCSICQEVDAGRFVDLIEIDAASRTKVEDTRDILDNVQYAPSRGRYKIYLIDEVHMLSTHSFNALLKTLEEPPEHVKFLLATTDPQKLPVTILSRCLQFSLKSISSEQIAKHLGVVLDAERISFDVDALRFIARAAEGSMRDAMSLTDQSIAFGNGQVLLTDVRNMLGVIDKRQVYVLLELFFSRKLNELFSFIEEVATQDINWIDLLSEVIQVLHQVAIAQVLPDAIDNTDGQREKVLGFAQCLPAEEVHLFYQTGLISRRDLLLAPDLRAGFEMALLRMLAFCSSPVNDESILSTKSADTSNLPQLTVSTPMQEAPSTGEQKTTPPISYVESNEVVASYESSSSGDYEAYVELGCGEEVISVANSVELSISANESTDQALENEVHDLELTENDLTQEWLALFPKLNLSGVLANVAANSALISKDDKIWIFHLAPNCSALLNENHSARLSEALFSLLATPVTAKIKVSSSLYLTPAKLSLLQREQRQKQAEQDMENDDFLLELKNCFSAEVIMNSIEPI